MRTAALLALYTLKPAVPCTEVVDAVRMIDAPSTSSGSAFSYCAGKHLRDGTLVEILADWRPPGFPFHVVYPQNRHLTHRLRLFIDWLAECFPQRVKG